MSAYTFQYRSRARSDPWNHQSIGRALPPGIASDLFGTYDYSLGLLAVIPPVCASVAFFPTTPEISETEMKRYGKT